MTLDHCFCTFLVHKIEGDFLEGIDVRMILVVEAIQELKKKRRVALKGRKDSVEEVHQ
jgi:hypothetical protein